MTLSASAVQAVAESGAVVLSIAALAYTWRRGRADDRRAAASERRVEAANQAAAEANRIAADALAVARSADDRAERLVQLEVESRDVQWTPRRVESGSALSFQHVGSDTAHDVVLIVEPAEDDDTWPRREEPHGAVLPGQRVGMNLSSEVREAEERAERDNRDSSLIWVNSGDLLCRVRLTWRSELGLKSSREWPEIRL